MQLNFDDYSNEQKLCDRGIKAVMSHNTDWADQAFIELKFFSQQRHHLYWRSEFTNTDIRTWLSQTCGEPSHPNAWSAFVRKCKKNGLIENTGSWLPSGAHAREQRVYRWSNV